MGESLKKPMVLLQMLFGALHAGFITIWAKGKDGKKVTYWYDLSAGGSLEDAAGTALELDAQGYDAYVSTCPSRTKGNDSSRINQGQVCSIPAFFMDCDVGKKECPASKDELKDKLLALPVPPRMIIDSGGGYHAYWPLAEPISISSKQELNTAKELLRGFADGIAAQLEYTGFDLSASEPARVLRLPGTHNHKHDTRAPVDVIHAAELPPYTMEELAPYIAESATQATQAPPPKQAPTDPAGLSDRQILSKMRAGRHGERLSRLWNGQWETDYKSQSEADIALLNALAYYAQGDTSRMDALFRQSGLYRTDKWDQMHGEQTYAEMTIGKACATTHTFYDSQYKKDQNGPRADDPVFGRFARAYEMIDGYRGDRGMLWAEAEEKGGMVTFKPLANFVALITHETTKDDGVETKKEFVLDGITATGKQLPPASVPTARFAAMSWVLDSWGADANIFPGSTIKDKVRYAVQAASAPLLKRNTVYTHAGWRGINGKTAFLYHGGAIGVDGISVELGGSLSMYSLPPATGDVKEAAAASMEMLTVLPPRIAIPLLAHMYLAPLHEPLEKAGCAPAFVLYLAGRSGTRKTTAAALALNHFGAAFNPKRLPASFNDTANAVQDKAFELKDMPLLVDDFCPTLNIAEQRRRIGIAQQLIRAWGDHAERGRMRSDATLQKAKPPRGLGMMTGEDVPSVGESGVARLYLIDVKPGDIQAGQALTELQRKAQEGYLARAMRGYIEWLIPQYVNLPASLAVLFTDYRKMAQDRLMGAHGRQPEAVAWLLVGFDMAIRYWKAVGILDDPLPLWTQAQEVLFDHSETQRQAIRDEEPVSMFLNALNELRASGEAVVLDLSEQLGLYPHSSCVGFQDSEYTYLMPGTAYGAVQEHFREQGTIFPISKNQLWKRMADSGIIETFGKETSKVKYIQGLKSQRVIFLKRQSAGAAEA